MNTKKARALTSVLIGLMLLVPACSTDFAEALAPYQYQMTFKLTAIVDNLDTLYSYVIKASIVPTASLYQTLGYELLASLKDQAVIDECGAALVSSQVVRTVSNKVFISQFGSSGITVDYVAVSIDAGKIVTQTTYWWIIPVGLDYQCWVNITVNTLFECNAASFTNGNAQNFASIVAQNLKGQSITVQDNYYQRGPQVKSLGTCSVISATSTAVSGNGNGGNDDDGGNNQGGTFSPTGLYLIAAVAVVGVVVVGFNSKRRR